MLYNSSFQVVIITKLFLDAFLEAIVLLDNPYY